MCDAKRAYILEVITDSEQFEYHNALVMYGKRKVGFRPIEDQSPFLDREVFFEEMLVEPMETSYGKPL
jgi:acetolactate synthase-1/2/3 large subunit